MDKNEGHGNDQGEAGGVRPPVVAPPRWDLSDLFAGRESEVFKDALLECRGAATMFSQKYKTRIARLSGFELAEAIRSYEAILEQASKIAAYASLSSAVDRSLDSWAQNISENIGEAYRSLSFFAHEINGMKEADILSKAVSSDLAPYVPWIGKIRAFKPHQLDMDVEELAARKSTVAENAWRRLYDQTLRDMVFTLDGREYTATDMTHIINHDADPALRKAAYAEFTRVLADNKKIFALVTNTMADIKNMYDARREFESVADSRHLANQIDPQVVEAMVREVTASYPRLSHRYYAWKAKKFGQTRLHPADRNAPLPGAPAKTYTWDEARDIVIAAYSSLSPEMGEIAARFFDNGWIDAEPRRGKRGGAFSSATVPSVHPYIMMNFKGSARDVLTLAHEIGHGIHQVMASGQGLLRAATPLTLAETASVFGEMLVFRMLLDRETDLSVRRDMLAGKIEDMINTVVRQTSFYIFEQRVHSERKNKGELTPERLCALWQETQKDSLGSAVNLDVKGAENMWMAVPHFIHTPFYVYAYAFGECLVNGLYDVYSRTPDKDAFVARYKALLSAGGTKSHEEALSAFGLDLHDRAFWRKGLSVIEGYIDELVKIDRQLSVSFNAAANDNKAADAAAEQAPSKKPPAKKPGGLG